MKKRLLYICLAVVFSLNAASVYAAKCTFSAGATALNFGSLNQANPVDVNVSAIISFTCKGGRPGPLPMR